ncbi:hypothetical protein A6F53_11245 [Levilactobacillus brevis]|nr:hypothetical protein A6F53_11245 [Levilactobacillus brevis]
MRKRHPFLVGKGVVFVLVTMDIIIFLIIVVITFTIIKRVTIVLKLRQRGLMRMIIGILGLIVALCLLYIAISVLLGV